MNLFHPKDVGEFFIFVFANHFHPKHVRECGTHSNGLDLPVKARTREIPCKPNVGTRNHRLTTDLSVVHSRFISRTRSALRSWMLTSRPMPFCFCKPFSSQGCPGIHVRRQIEIPVIDCGKTHVNFRFPSSVSLHIHAREHGRQFFCCLGS